MVELAVAKELTTNLQYLRLGSGFMGFNVGG